MDWRCLRLWVPATIELLVVIWLSVVLRQLPACGRIDEKMPAHDWLVLPVAAVEALELLPSF
jgi:hypothetical protein